MTSSSSECLEQAPDRTSSVGLLATMRALALHHVTSDSSAIRLYSRRHQHQIQLYHLLTPIMDGSRNPISCSQNPSFGMLVSKISGIRHRIDIAYSSIGGTLQSEPSSLKLNELMFQPQVNLKTRLSGQTTSQIRKTNQPISRETMERRSAIHLLKCQN